MQDWLVTAVMSLIAHAAGEEGTTPGNGTVVIDLLNMQWWQGLSALIVALGLSPAPWILGLATGKIQFTATADAAHQRELAARKEAYEEQVEQNQKYHETVLASRDERYQDLVKANQRNIEVAEQQKQRGDKLEAALAQSTAVIGQTNHILLELKGAAEEVSPSG